MAQSSGGLGPDYGCMNLECDEQSQRESLVRRLTSQIRNVCAGPRVQWPESRH